VSGTKAEFEDLSPAMSAAALPAEQAELLAQSLLDQFNSENRPPPKPPLPEAPADPKGEEKPKVPDSTKDVQLSAEAVKPAPAPKAEAVTKSKEEVKRALVEKYKKEALARK